MHALRRAGGTVGPSLVEDWSSRRRTGGWGQWLWLAESAAAVHAAALLLECPGRTALLFVWPVDRPLDESVSAALASAAVKEADPGRIRMVQLLLEVERSALSRGLAGAGFIPLAALDYMRRATAAPTQLELAPGLSLRSYRPALHDLFARTILASYEGTLDCPALLGMRHIEDIIAGHKATGRFVPELWLVVCEGDRGVGVMFINPVESAEACELVYLGLAMSHRGKGLGRALLQHGLGMAREYGSAQMMLAVDRQNQPALGLYRSLGFVTTTTRYAWIKATR